MEKKTISTPQPVPPDLHAHIMRGIHRARARRDAWYASLLGVLGCGSLCGVWITGSYLVRALSHNGFTYYLSLVLSDFSVMTHAWKETLLSLAESLPAFELGFFLATVFVFVWSVQSLRSFYVYRVSRG